MIKELLIGSAVSFAGLAWFKTITEPAAIKAGKAVIPAAIAQGLVFADMIMPDVIEGKLSFDEVDGRVRAMMAERYDDESWLKKDALADMWPLWRLDVFLKKFNGQSQ